MRSMTRFLSLVPVLFVVIGLGACDSAEMTAPGTERTIGAQASVIGGVTVVYSGSRTIGTSGGTVAVTDQYGALVATLKVPAGAVRQSTLFTVEIDSNRQIHLLATARSLNDIGTAGFHKPVTLTFNSAYVDAASVRGRRIGTVSTTSTTSTFSTLSRTSTTEATGEDPEVTVEMDSFAGYGPTTD